jgi:glycosyltransferase involved in cell wall biosynthesis
LPAFDIFWLTSMPRSEGIPTVIGEAMACGVPVVASDVGGVGEAVADGETGFLVPPSNPEALVTATLPLLEDPALRARMGREARARAERLFALDVCADRHLDGFHRALQRRRSSDRDRPRLDGSVNDGAVREAR